MQAKIRSFFKDEGVLLTVQASARGESGTLFGGGAQNRMDITNLPQVSITAERKFLQRSLLEIRLLVLNPEPRFDSIAIGSKRPKGE